MKNNGFTSESENSKKRGVCLNSISLYTVMEPGEDLSRWIFHSLFILFYLCEFCIVLLVPCGKRIIVTSIHVNMSKKPNLPHLVISHNSAGFGSCNFQQMRQFYKNCMPTWYILYVVFYVESVHISRAAFSAPSLLRCLLDFICLLTINPMKRTDIITMTPWSY